jgi:glycosyltransferase involved in cell wall biosynthesis
MKIGISADFFLPWQGGRDLLRLILGILTAADRSGHDVLLVTSPGKDSWYWRMARTTKRVLTTPPPPDLGWIKHEFIRESKKEAIQNSLGQMILSVPVCQCYGATRNDKCKCSGARHNNELVGALDVLFPMMQCRDWFENIPHVAYIPDCQHRRLPHFFPELEFQRRNEEFTAILSSPGVVIVNSKAAKADLIRFFGPVRSEIVSLPFAAAPEPDWLDDHDHSVLDKYALRRPYFLCSNQFWLHKNHQVVFDAIKIAKTEGKEINFVFTGPMYESRDPDYVSGLLRYVREQGIEQHCRLLGLLPKMDQIRIMKLAEAVVQPTLFEGGPGGGAVYDAVALGCPTLVSDIAINREIEDEVTLFFDPHSPQDLLAAIRRLATMSVPRPTAAALRAAGEARRQRCGQVLLSAFARALEISRQTGLAGRPQALRA